MGHVNNLVERDRRYLIDIRLEGLVRLDYRGSEGNHSYGHSDVYVL